MDADHRRVACEELLRRNGFSRCRILVQGGMVRIQLPQEEFARFFDTAFRERIVESLKATGVVFVSLDLDELTPPSGGEFPTTTPPMK